MNRIRDKKFLSMKKQSRLFGWLALFCGALLGAQMLCQGLLLLSAPVDFPATVSAENIDAHCAQTPVAAVLTLDRSGSMQYWSSCSWWEYVCTNSLCATYRWKKNITYDASDGWCSSKSQAEPHESVYISYASPKLAAAQAAATDFLGLLGDSDQSAVVSFSDQAALDKTLSADHSETITAINELTAAGATNIGGALALSVAELSSGNVDPTAARIIILLTDGKANKYYSATDDGNDCEADVISGQYFCGPGMGEDSTAVQSAYAMAAAAAASNIKIYTIGLGANTVSGDINSIMLKNIAEQTNGKYFPAPSADDLDEIYSDISDLICCGDGHQDAAYGEECDDGNQLDADGCDSLCRIEITDDDISTTTEETDDVATTTEVVDDDIGTTTEETGYSGTSTEIIDDSVGTTTEEINDSGTSTEIIDDSIGTTTEETDDIATTTEETTKHSSGGHQTLILSNSSTSSPELATKEPLAEPIVLGEEGVPQLIIAKTVNKKTALPGEKDIEFIVTIKNTGNLIAFNVKLRDIMPAGLVFQDNGSGTEKWDLGDIAAGQTSITKYKVMVLADAEAKIYTNNALASADNHGIINASADVEIKAVAVLAATGFSDKEFLVLLGILFLFSVIILFLRKGKSSK